jgi:outer membrane protein OmpA-like peptidoglycan-associated protein
VSGVLTVDADLNPGAYVLQANGVTSTDQIRSVNMLLDVMDRASRMRAGQVRDAAFYVGGTARISDAGEAKLRAMVTSIPKDAENVQVNVVGVSLSQDSPEADLELARKRAQGIVDFLQASGVKGSYTVSVSTTFEVRDADRSIVTGVALDQPATSSSGKPLTTATISFDAPAP